MGILYRAKIILIPTLNFSKNKVIRNAYLVHNHRQNVYPLFTKYVLGSSAWTWDSTPQIGVRHPCPWRSKRRDPLFYVSQKKMHLRELFFKERPWGSGAPYLAPPRSWTTETGVIHIPRRRRKLKIKMTNARPMQGHARPCNALQGIALPMHRQCALRMQPIAFFSPRVKVFHYINALR